MLSSAVRIIQPCLPASWHATVLLLISLRKRIWSVCSFFLFYNPITTGGRVWPDTMSSSHQFTSWNERHGSRSRLSEPDFTQIDQLNNSSVDPEADSYSPPVTSLLPQAYRRIALEPSGIGMDGYLEEDTRGVSTYETSLRATRTSTRYFSIHVVRWTNEY